jgi:hypothetical protein
MTFVNERTCCGYAIARLSLKRKAVACVCQLDLAPFDLLFWPHPLVIHQSVPGRSEALRRP